MNAKNPFVRSITWLLIAAQLLTPSYGAVTSISSSPVDTSSTIPPNVIFGLDDSGSMDSEVMENTSDGAFWYNYDTKSFWDSTNSRFNFNDAGTQSTTMFKYIYLFPNGTNSDARRLDEGSGTNYYNGHHAIPPTKQFAFTRSYAYNPLYYNPSTTYTAWAPAYISSASQTFPAASPTAPRSHPWITSSGGGSVSTTASSTYPIASDIDPSSSTYQAFNWTFLMLPGMTIPAGSYAKKQGTSGLASIGTSDITVSTADKYYYAAIKYYPATYWVPDSTCTDTSQAYCATAPYAVNGTTYLRRYEIKSGNTFPSGRSYADELQNFANWFTYYRKRKLMLAASMGQVLPQMTSIRGGMVRFNSLSNVTMYDFSVSDNSLNYQPILGQVYTNPSSGGTPTRETLKYIGTQFTRTDSSAPILYACQRNAAMIMTDGFAYATTVTVPSYSQSTYGGSKPYQTTYTSTLADIALAYYTNLLRSDMTQGLLTTSTSDPNPNLHMTTYALTLGAKGVLYQGTDTADPFTTYPSWTNPTVNYSPYAVDDLWHATINGRGKMMTATDTSTTASSILSALTNIADQASAQSSVGISRVNLTSGDSTAYISSYHRNGWYGDLKAYPVDSSTGDVTYTTSSGGDAMVWSAKTQLDATAATDRIIAAGTGDTTTKAVPFRQASLPSSMLTLFGSTTTAQTNVINYLRGDRTNEGTYRTRTSVLGDIDYSEPAVVKGATASYLDSGYGDFKTSISSRKRMVYEGANDGMLHAFDASTGNELWAYVPSFVTSNLANLTSTSYQHQYYVDGSPTVNDVADSDGNWKTILVSGLRAGGKGFFAIDVTNPEMANETTLASKVIWEFPNANTPTATKNNVGLSFGKPVIAKLANYGWVVLLTSGYNNTSGDGLGHLFVVNATTGDLIADIATTVGSTTSPSGLAQINAYASNASSDATIATVYGGDLYGNLWRFDLSATSSSSWNAVKLATATNSSGTAQPITTIPELALVSTSAGNKRMVFFGTGKMLADSDLTVSQTQTFYAIVDDRTASPTVATRYGTGKNLAQATLTISGTSRTTSGASVDYTTQKGWYMDLPSGEEVSTNSTAAYGYITFTSNQPSGASCDTKSYLYIVSQASATELTGVTAGQYLGNAMASDPVVVVTSTGTVRIITHLSNNDVVTKTATGLGSTSPKAVAWKAIAL